MTRAHAVRAHGGDGRPDTSAIERHRKRETILGKEEEETERAEQIAK